MNLPEYVTVDEVRRVCKELGISDWTAVTEADITVEEAGKILAEVNVAGMNINVEDFRQGLAVELEHGTRFEDANVTNNHPILTGKIVLAHLKETLDYYHRLDVAEVEGDLMHAVIAGDLARIQAKYRKLITVKGALHRAVSDQFK
ncbi:MAG TPA: DUF5661 family protein [Acidobacteriota bacterium]|nr:DUF5661 family protein [Acidobacteriota bacterium]